MKLSRNFTLAELTRSQLATRKGIDNTPSWLAIDELRRLCDQVLQPLRDCVKRPVTVTSGYRSPELCKALGSSRYSMHTVGAAADIHVSGLSPRAVAKLAQKLPNVMFGRILLEFPDDGWVHIESRHPFGATRDGPLMEAHRGRFGRTRYRVVDRF